MTAAALALTDFLLARIAEDEAFAAMVTHVQPMSAGESRRVEEGNASFMPLNLASSPERVLAECEAKRRIVDLVGIDGGVFDDDAEDGIRYDGYPITRALAAVYSEHPDYREEWKP